MCLSTIKKMPRIHSIKDTHFLAKVRRIPQEKARKEIIPEDELRQAKTSVTTLLSDFLNQNHSTDEAKQATSIFRSRFSELELDLADELKQKYKEGNDQVKKNVIDLLSELGEKEYRVIELIALHDERNRSSLIQVMKSKPRELRADYFKNCGTGRNIEFSQIESYADFLIEMGEHDPEFILSNMTDGKVSKYNDLSNREGRFAILIQIIIKKLQEKSVKIPFNYFRLLYSPHMLESSFDQAFDLIKKHIKQYPEDKKLAEELVVNTFNSYNHRKHSCSYFGNCIGSSIWNYAELLGIKRGKEIVDLISDERPLIVHKSLCILSSTKYFEKYGDLVAQRIADELKNGNLLPFAQIVYSGSHPGSSLKKTALKVFLIKDLALENLTGNDPMTPIMVYVYDRTAPHHTHYSPGIQDGSCELMLEWALKGKNETVRKNAARLLCLMYDPLFNTFIKQSGYKEKLLKAAGV